ncbi:MAG: hypothetical protein HA494_02930 [Thaumarchaeota archaeon]|nr:hypothetical protein [Nitrososphaerota archaeon]
MKIEEFVHRYGEPYSVRLGIDLLSRRDEEIVKWFLASILYSKPIRESSATKTYFVFKSRNILTVDKILNIGWDGLVDVLDEGGYTRYDFSTATKLLSVFGELKKRYGGSLWKLYRSSKDGRDLERRLKALGKGVGDTTVSIFLRDMRLIWEKADPKPTPLVELAMKYLNIKDLKAFAKEKGLSLVSLETALLRLAKDFIKKGRMVEVEI